MTDRDKEKLITNINGLNNDSKVDLYYFMKRMNIPHTENINGQFFLISDISEAECDTIQNHVSDLLELDKRMTFDSTEVTEQSFDQTQYGSCQSNTANLDKPFEINENILYFFEKQKNISKRTISTKYYISKKKYNKMHIPDNIKTEDCPDLSELVKEEYILR